MKPEVLAECPMILREFLGYTETIKGKSPRTVEQYYMDLLIFFRYIKQKRGLVPKEQEFEKISISDVDLALIETITLTDVYEYMNFVASVRSNHEAARARKSSSLRSFFKYLTSKTGQLKVNPVQELDSPKLKSSLPKYLTLEQSLELLQSVDGEHKERDFCMLTLFLNCGLRLSELVGLNLQDIRDDNTMRVLGKGNKERVLYLNDACLNAIKNYLAVRPRDGLTDRYALFISRNRNRISPKTVQFIVKKYLGDIGMGGPGYSVHKLRHTAATLMYQNGVDIRVLKDVLGHENLGTTQIYTHLSSKLMEDAVRANPLSKVNQRASSPTSRKKSETNERKEPEHEET